MAFDPADLGGLILDLDVLQGTTMLESDTSSTPGLAAPDDLAVIGTWLDQSSAANHQSTTNATYRPIYHADGGHIGTGTNPYLEFTGGRALGERAPHLSAAMGTAGTVIELLYKNSSAGDGDYQTFYSSADGGNAAMFVMRLGGTLQRYSTGPSRSMSDSTAHAIAYAFQTVGTNQETLYLDAANTPVITTGTASAPGSFASVQIGAWIGGAHTSNSEYYRVLAYDHELQDSEVAQVLAYFNTRYGTDFNASAGPLTAPSVVATEITQTSFVVTADAPAGGTYPYTYQWYRSTAEGDAASIAVSGNLVSGATDLSATFTPLTAQITYYSVLKVTDANDDFVLTDPLATTTHGTTVVNVWFIGDSITYGEKTHPESPVTEFALAMQAAYPYMDVQVVNRGQSGTTLRSYSGINGGSALYIGLISDMTDAGANVLGIMDGTNDWWFGPPSGGDATLTAANYQADMIDIVSHVTDAGFDVYVNQLMYRADHAEADDPDTGLPAFNAALHEIDYAGISDLAHEGDTASYAYFKAHPVELLDGLHTGVLGNVHEGGFWASSMGPSIAAKFPPGAHPVIAPTIGTITATGANTFRVPVTTAESGVTSFDYDFDGDETADVSSPQDFTVADAGATHYWRARSRNSAGVGPWSAKKYLGGSGGGGTGGGGFGISPYVSTLILP